MLTRETPDVAAFAIGEKYPASFPRTAVDTNGTAITGGTPAIEDCFKVNYDRFFLFGNGDNDVLTGQGWDYWTKDASSSVIIKSHGGMEELLP